MHDYIAYPVTDGVRQLLYFNRLRPKPVQLISMAILQQNGHSTTVHDDSFNFDPLSEALDTFALGEFLVVMDDEGRENEGDLICAACICTTEQMAFMIKHTSGYVCAPCTPDRLAALQIPMMVENNQERHRTAYAITVDFKEGTTTGISAHDRALTARKLADPSSTPNMFSRPGHLVPLRSNPQGVLGRRGHTEAATGARSSH